VLRLPRNRRGPGWNPEIPIPIIDPQKVLRYHHSGVRGRSAKAVRIRSAVPALACHDCAMNLQSLPEALREWTDVVGAEWALAKCLGLMPRIPWNPGDPSKPGAGMKAAFWSSNLFGESLARILQELVRMGALEYHEEKISFRWCQTFQWEQAAERPDDAGQMPLPVACSIPQQPH
jgi:hypothetical protein